MATPVNADQELAARILTDAIKSLEPKLAGEVWEWAESRLQLIKTPTSRIGPLSFESSPYMLGEWSPLWAWKRYKYIANIWGTQLGKTLIFMILLAYIVDNEPGPTMLTLPDMNFGRKKSVHEFKPFIEDNLEKYLTDDPDDFSNLSYKFKNMGVVFGWTGSPSSLAGSPCRYVLNDEAAKAQKTAEEGDAMALSDRRTSSYGEFARNYLSTTPALRKMPGWRELIAGTYAEFRVPCHHCHRLQVMRWDGALPEFDAIPGEDPPEAFAGGFRLGPSKLEPDERAATVRYHCIFCDEAWTTRDKNAATSTAYETLVLERILAHREKRADTSNTGTCGIHEVRHFRCFNGVIITPETPDSDVALQLMKSHRYRARWVPRYPKRSRYSSHLPGWYSSIVSLETIALNYIKGLSDPDLMRDHLNADRAEASDLDEERGEVADTELRARILPGAKSGVIPVDDAFLFLTADVHKRHLDYRIRAWVPGTLTSYGVEHGVLMVEEGANPCSVLAPLFAHDRTWPTLSGKHLRLDRALIDASYLPGEVYAFALRHPNRVFPIMGRSIRDNFTTTTVEFTDPSSGLTGKFTQILFNDDAWKDFLAFTLRSGKLLDPGFFHFEEGLSDRFFRELQGERVIETKNAKGQLVRQWKRVGDNHAFDLEKYQLLASRAFALQTWQAPAETAPAAKSEEFNPYTGRLIESP